ncbi:hypothetical protein BT63DRAFT_226530 [Microthyrium microscopicum]|uniref:Dynamin-type G domain-containing protein n=1 Tax=Microthyrium microscopicum TaxID=703497 RepID=A0A6A6UFU1_9PEZI|nr:hypothetical protein BT63DRAFT_226530 [Microthyrium microscopicum]
MTRYSHTFPRGESSRETVQLPTRPSPSLARASEAPTTMSSTEIVDHSNPAVQTLGSDMKKLFQCLNNLHHTGIDAIANITIPKIAMIGDQSSGKSSLVEALSEISVPRNTNTCTRCPMEINLIQDSAEEWIARVSLRRPYAYNPDATPGRFYPWAERGDHPLDIEKFAEVNNKDALQSAIYNAQAAILNPSHSVESFRSGFTVDTNEAPFSPNRVIIEIRGNSLPNLSFVDLPGIISQTDEGGQEIVDFVERLAESYIQEEKTIVLLVISMENDIQNSKASSVVNRMKVNHRCMGVLTKPDRMAVGGDVVKDWVKVLSGEKYRRELGYRVCKLRSQQELHISSEQARLNEVKYFDSPEWSSDFNIYTDLLGIGNLASALSINLLGLALQCLPEIQFGVEQQLKLINARLAKCPEPPKHAYFEVTKIVQNFAQIVQMKAAHEEQAISNDVRDSATKHIDVLKKSILEDLRPKITVGADLGPIKGKRLEEVASAAGRASREPSISPRKRNGESDVSPSKARKVDGGLTTPQKNKNHRQATVEDDDDDIVVTGWSPVKTPSRGTVNQPLVGSRFTPMSLKIAIDKYQLPGLPGEVNPNGLNAIILSTLKSWDKPVKTLFKAIDKQMSASLAKGVLHESVCGP